MKSEHYQEWFTERLKGDLNPQQQAELDHHLQSCNDCRTEFMKLSQVWNDMKLISSPEPSPALKTGFEAVLADFEQSQNEKTTIKAKLIHLLQWRPQIALGGQIMIVLFSFATGYLLFAALNKQERKQLAGLSGQVHQFKQTTVLALLENPSASERIKAVSYTREIKHADKTVIAALLNTLNNDSNVNVRLSTLDVLIQMSKNPVVREGLIRSITQQETPLMQIAIAEAMLKLQDERSVKPLRQLLRQKDLDADVRDKIKETINSLI